MLIQNNNIHKNILNISISLIPVSFIIGNLIINLNIFFILLYCLFFYRLQLFKINLSNLDKLVLIFFTYTALVGVYNNLFNFNFPLFPDQNIVIKKSFLYLRFLFLYFIIKFLILNKVIDYKLLFYSFGLSSLFVSLDVIFQYIFGYDIFGYESSVKRLSGPFGEEKIAGSFIQRFFIFIPYTMLLFINFKKKIFLNIFLILISIITLIGAVLSGNRIPLVMLIATFILFICFEKEIRRNFLIIFFVFLIGFIYLAIERSFLNYHYKIFISQGAIITKYLGNKIMTGKIIAPELCKNIDIEEDTIEYKNLNAECSKYLNVYIKEIESGIQTWQRNKFFGGGIKSFRLHCSRVDRSKMEFFVSKDGKVNCNNHPHNYYLQIAAELGIFGLLITVALFFLIIVKSFLFIFASYNNDRNKRIFIPFFIIFFLEIFPFKTTGSFFTTSNSTFLFIILSFVVGLLELKKLKRNE